MCSPRRSAPSSPQVRADNAETARAKAEEELRAFQRPDYLVELQQALEASEQRAVDAQAAAATATAAAAAAEQSIAQLHVPNVGQYLTKHVQRIWRCGVSTRVRDKIVDVGENCGWWHSDGGGGGGSGALLEPGGSATTHAATHAK